MTNEKLKNAILFLAPKAPVDILFQYFDIFNITEIQKQIDIIAQFAQESGNFTRYTENLNYSAQGLAKTWKSRFANTDGTPNKIAYSIARNPEKIANYVYANRLGNGDVNSGDGWRFRGRGVIQITGKTNYSSIGKIAFDLQLITDSNYFVKHPESLSNEPFNIVSGFLFLKMNNLLDKLDFKTLTKRINGGLIGYEERLKKKHFIESKI